MKYCWDKTLQGKLDGKTTGRARTLEGRCWGWGSENTIKEKANSKKLHSRKAKPSPVTTPCLICTMAKTMALPNGAHPLMSLYKTFRQVLSRDKKTIEELLMALLQIQKHLWGQLPEKQFSLAPGCNSKPAIRCPKRIFWKRDKGKDTLVEKKLAYSSKRFNTVQAWHYLALHFSKLIMHAKPKKSRRKTN